MKKLVRALVFVLVLAMGAGFYAWLVSSEGSPPRQPAAPTVVLVTTAPAEAAVGRAKVKASGTVVPARSVRISAEVPGRVTATGPQLVPGGRLRRGDLLVRLDVRDYDLALLQQRAAVGQAQLQLDEELGRKAVAAKEWTLMSTDMTPSQEGKRLALREAQAEMAQVSLEAARSRLQQAELARQRTTISAPFDALVVDEAVEAGQYVQPGAALATLVASDVFWVRVPLPMDRLPWISLPQRDGQGGSAARVIQKVDRGVAVIRDGRVAQLLPDLDERGKMARLVIEIPSPLGDEAAGELPILLGAYVEVEIEGPKLDGLVSVPKSAVHDDHKVWVVVEGQLQPREVTVGWTEGERAYLTSGLAPLDRVLTSRLSTPAAGLKVKEETFPPDGHEAPP